MIRLGASCVCIDEWIDILAVKIDRKRMYKEHIKQGKDIMAEDARRITGPCRRRKDRINKEKHKAVIEK